MKQQMNKFCAASHVKLCQYQLYDIGPNQRKTNKFATLQRSYIFDR